MADNLRKRGPAHRVRINMGEPYEVVYWSKRFGCSPAQLWEAVESVGLDAEIVRTFIAAQNVKQA